MDALRNLRDNDSVEPPSAEVLRLADVIAATADLAAALGCSDAADLLVKALEKVERRALGDARRSQH